MICKIGDFIVDINARYFYHDAPSDRDTLFLIESMQMAFENSEELRYQKGYTIIAKHHRDMSEDCRKVLRGKGFYDDERGGAEE